VDFYRIVKTEPDKRGVVAVFPDFTPAGFTDLMIRGGSFYAIWDNENKTWSTDEYDVTRLVDADLRNHVTTLPPPEVGRYELKLMESFKSMSWLNFKQFIRSVSDRYTPLDRKLVFLGEETTKEDYVTKSLPYRLENKPTPSWDELIDVLYSPLERQKIEWAIGAVVKGDSRNIQKFLVFYGSAGTGKSTVLNIIEKLFVGYFSTFEAKALGSNNGAFSTAAFKHNPLVAIQHDGDLSRIEDNTKLNSIVAHEDILINEKFQTAYSMKIDSFLFMGTNKPVRITDSRSGLVRRVIDVHPTGNRVGADHYTNLMSQIDFELGGIAQHCLDVYLGLGRSYYNAYRPVEMMAQTDYFYNFVAASYDMFLEEGGVTSARAWDLFKAFCDDQRIDVKMPQFKFREELKNYFEKFEQRANVNGEWIWNWYSGFDTKRFIQHDLVDDNREVFEMTEDISILDEVLESLPAQYGRVDGHGDEVPEKRWDNVTTVLKDLDSKKLHYVKIPQNHIVIDFDLKDANGEKSLELNLAAAAKWPKTYGELSKGGQGVHLHYMYDGDTSLLKPVFDKDIEVKVFNGNSSLRRRLSRCNNTPIATMSSGLPLKEKKMLSQETMQNEKQLRSLIVNCLQKKIHSATKPNIDMIEHVLNEAIENKMVFDVTDMQSEIISFALTSTHQSERCLEAVQRMKFRSEESVDEVIDVMESQFEKDDSEGLCFFDIEVYPNLFLIRWKMEGEGMPIITMLNPKPEAVAALFKMKLVGYNCRKYDNHILYAAGNLGYSVQELYKLSQRIINNEKNATFAAAYNLSYVDVYDYLSASGKMTLKKWQIKLGIHHQEMDIPWDQPVPDDRIEDVIEYCGNDIISLEAVHNERQGDYKARLVLAALSGLTPNHTTNAHSAAIVFGTNKRPQSQFKYTHLETMFPGYVFDRGVSTYRQEKVGEGGYVYAEPGIYENVALLDVASMHPTSIEELNLFGNMYTQKFSDIKNARLAIKNGDIDAARRMLDGQLGPFLDGVKDKKDAKDLSEALKTVINSVYGLTSARFENAFRDPRNKDNIVAKRGALFMLDLKAACQERGLTVAHIKTDSIKIPNATPDDIAFVTEFGKKYGYDFEHEATYEKFALFNDAVYVALKDGEWSATGKQFAEPFVFKTLFTNEEIEFEDLHEARSILKGSMCLDFNKDLDRKDGFTMDENVRFIGRTGLFVPVKEGCGGGILYRVVDDKAHAVPDTKGYLWKEASLAKRDEVNMEFFDKKIAKAMKAIEDLGGNYVDLVGKTDAYA
jgi:hypothetical protein